MRQTMPARQVGMIPGMAAMLLENNQLHQVIITGHGAGFVTIRLSHGHVRLVKRHELFVMPDESQRLQEVLQENIDRLSGLLHELKYQENA